VPRADGPNLIAELKRASPSAGLLRAEFDPPALARQYAAAGAHALSVLTDERFFGGRLEYLEQVKAAVGLPVLRKDFLIDPYQLHESRACGADAVLLIAEVLPPARLVELVRLAAELELGVLLEVHARDVLVQVLLALDGTDRAGLLLGINNRDLRTQRVDLGTFEKLADLAPPGLPLVAESGIRTRLDVQRLHAAGARAVLVGEVLLHAADPAAAIRRLRGT
jgi:indole-3-glycerol phosphate synthase